MTVKANLKKAFGALVMASTVILVLAPQPSEAEKLSDAEKRLVKTEAPKDLFLVTSAQLDVFLDHSVPKLLDDSGKKRLYVNGHPVEIGSFFMTRVAKKFFDESRTKPEFVNVVSNDGNLRFLAAVPLLKSGAPIPLCLEGFAAYNKKGDDGWEYLGAWEVSADRTQIEPIPDADKLKVPAEAGRTPCTTVLIRKNKMNSDAFRNTSASM